MQAGAAVLAPRMTYHLASRVVAASAFVVLASLAATARAGGLEYTGQGAQSLARGGAVAARADDPMVLAHNPAGLAELRGTQFLLNINLAFMDACVDPAGYYGWGVYAGGNHLTQSGLVDPETGETTVLQLGDIDTSGATPVAVEADYYVDPYDTVCLDQNVVPIPQLAWTTRVTEALGIGFGFIFPSVAPGGRWGGENGVIRGDDGELRPTPTRYMGISSSNIAMFPTLGAGLRLLDELRVGLAVEWGVIAVNNYTMAANTGGAVPAGDILSHVKVQDFFVPAFTVSTHLVPTDAIDFVVAFRWQDDLKADGDIDLTTGIANADAVPYINEHIPILSLRQKMPWKLRAGVRYADRLVPRPAGTGQDEGDPGGGEVIHDALQDELWDVELDVEYQLNSRNREQVLVYEPENQVQFRFPVGSADPIIFPNPADPDTVIEKYWKDQVSLRLGGTVNLLPGVVGVSAGAHYENRGVNPDYMQIDFWPVSRVGLHTGVTLRVARSIDLVFAYAHIFQETIIVAAPEHRARHEIYAEWAASPPPKVVNGIDKTVGVPLDKKAPPTGTVLAEEPSQGAPDGVARLDQNVSRSLSNEPPLIINAGRYRSDMDILAIGATFHF